MPVEEDQGDTDGNGSGLFEKAEGNG